MSTNAVVNAVQSLVNGVMGPSTSYNGLVLAYKPLVVDPNSLPVAWVTTHSGHEERRGLGGQAGGNKWVRHVVAVDVVNASSTPSVDEPGFRTLLDTLRQALRVNQTLGGVTLAFGESMDVQFDEPSAAGGVMHYHALLTGEAIEQISPAAL